MQRLTLDQAADLTWQAVSLEHAPQARHRLSADIVATTEDGEPIVSVIHLDDRRHWNLVVLTLDHLNPPGHRHPPVEVGDVQDLPVALTTRTDIADGSQIRLLHPFGGWLLNVEVLPNAKV